MAFVVEPWVPSVGQPVIELVLSIQRAEFGLPITLDDQPDLANVGGAYGRGRGGFWTAREGARVIGTVGLLDHGEAGAALRKMFVAADRRGRQHGVATALFAALLDHAKHSGLRCIRLGTRPEMYAAHRFYEKHGFVRIEPEALPASFPRMALDSVFYRRDL